MTNVLIASYDMEVGGVERSMASMLDQFDYGKHEVDLMLYSHQGDFMDLLTDKVNLLHEQKSYATFRKSISEVIKAKQYMLGFSRLLSKAHAGISGRLHSRAESGYYQMQLMWKYALPFLPKLERQYDAAISYLWPHYYVADKVNARKKLAWIHTDYSTIDTNMELDLRMWNKFDHIIAVSEACKESFLAKYSSLRSKVVVIENITSPDFIRSMADEDIDHPMSSDHRFKLITVARLSHAKGIDNAVRALKRLRDKGYDQIAWYIVGYGGDEEKLRELIAEYGLQDSFILLGKQTNPYPYMKASDLYVQPSRYEGKAVTVTEAKIIGKPVLITNYSTAASQVIDGVDGLITALSVDGIADGIERLYHNSDLRQQLADHCSQTDYSNGYELNQLYPLLHELKGSALRES